MSNFLHIRKSGDDFEKLKTGFSTYREAVLCGQDLAGYGNFFVETSGVPTPEEQLLLPPVTKRRGSGGRPAPGRSNMSAKERQLLDLLNL